MRTPFPPGKSRVPEISDADFKAKTKKGISVVAFRADWCGFCEAAAPTIDAIARKHGTQLSVFRVDFDKSRKTAGRFKVEALPTVVFLKNGREVGRVMGANNAAILAGVKKILGGGA